MKIDIEQLSESELIDLNHRIVARLRMFAQFRAHTSMRIVGMLVRYNKKTVSLVTDDGHRWNVSPALLTRAVTSTPKPESQNVVTFRKK
jgi:hypothetical protein